jgi:hypothetical protein
MAISKYTDLITSQHKTRPKFMTWLSAALTIVDDGVTTVSGLPADFDIDTAVGVQLDVLGQIVGRERTLTFQPTDGSSPVLDDDNYRTVLKAKIAQNHWDGTIGQVQELWQALFPEQLLVIVDNQDMSVNLAVVGITTQLEKDLVSNGYIIPKPAGVKANYSFYDDAIFGYDLYNSAFKGYDEGFWFQSGPLFAYDYNNSELTGYDKGAWA